MSDTWGVAAWSTTIAVDGTLGLVGRPIILDFTDTPRLPPRRTVLREEITYAHVMAEKIKQILEDVEGPEHEFRKRTSSRLLSKFADIMNSCVFCVKFPEKAIIFFR